MPNRYRLYGCDWPCFVQFWPSFKLSLLFHCYLGYFSQIILKNSKSRVSGCQPNLIYLYSNIQSMQK